MSFEGTAAGRLGVSETGALGGVSGLIRFLAITFQLGLFIVVIWQFNLESRAFLYLSVLTFFGWCIHYFLPLRHRLLFFVVLSLAGIEVVFGIQEQQVSVAGLTSGLWIIALGLGLIGICHLPVSFWLRVALLVAIGGVMGFARADVLAVPWSSAIWPILASMFMFRLIVYLYQLRHAKKPTTLTERLAYFFMLPNVCFPLFPVVDFQTFRQCHYSDADRHRTYQIGIHWLFRGVFHLLLYRYIYQNFVIDVSDVQTRGDLMQYMLWPFLLYLRVSGTFHIISGMLRLFGFNLPETHHLFYMASSFNDFWRRINIYWKDFQLKIFYYPVYFRIRKLGEIPSLVIATIIAFVMTWLLHAYQWFWLRGTLLLKWNDFIFWMLLALLVVGNSVYEVKRGRKRRLEGQALSWGETAATSLRSLGVFATICILWSFWSTGSVAEWLSVWKAAANPGAFGATNMLIVAGVLLAVVLWSAANARGLTERPFNFTRSAAGATVAAMLAIVMSSPHVYVAIGPTTRTVMESLRSSDLNRRDFAKLERGYYESLLDVGQFNRELWAVYRNRPSDWVPLPETEAVRWTTGLPLYELRPSLAFRNKGVTIRTNRWGMRDRDYEKARPANTLRIAVLGASFPFGVGIENEEIFEALLEDRLNREAAGGRYARYEILNFSVPGHSALGRLAALENKVFDFEPNYVFYVEHLTAERMALGKVVTALLRRSRHSYEFLDEIARKAGVDLGGIDESTNAYGLLQKLNPYAEEILTAIYRRIVASSRKHGAVPVMIFWPRPENGAATATSPLELRLAREVGFKVIDLSGVYDGHDPKRLWVARWDHHTNALGNRLIAERLYELLRQAEKEIPLGLPKRRPSVSTLGSRAGVPAGRSEDWATDAAPAGSRNRS